MARGRQRRLGMLEDVGGPFRPHWEDGLPLAFRVLGSQPRPFEHNSPSEV